MPYSDRDDITSFDVLAFEDKYSPLPSDMLEAVDLIKRVPPGAMDRSVRHIVADLLEYANERDIKASHEQWAKDNGEEYRKWIKVNLNLSKNGAPGARKIS